MNDPGLTLHGFFALENMSRDTFATIAQNPNVSALKERWKEKALIIAWNVVFNKVFTQFKGMFGIDIPEIIAKAWCKIPDLTKYCDQKQYPPDQVVFVALVEHTIESTHKPSLEILFNDARLGEIEFDVKLELELKGLELTVQNGAITGFRLGSCKGKGDISCEGIKFWERQTKEIDLPLSMELKDPVSIC